MVFIKNYKLDVQIKISPLGVPHVAVYSEYSPLPETLLAALTATLEGFFLLWNRK